jgi:hypothetical protein
VCGVDGIGKLVVKMVGRGGKLINTVPVSVYCGSIWFLPIKFV